MSTGAFPERAAGRRRTIWKYARWVVLAGAAAYAYYVLRDAHAIALKSRDRDLTQDFLAVQALAHGLSPYDLIPEMAIRHYGRPYLSEFNHPTPHSPVLLALLSPLSGVSDGILHEYYLFFSVAAIVLAVGVICFLERNRGIDWVDAALLICLALSAPSTGQDLKFGQHNSWLLLIAVILWRCFRSERYMAFAIGLGFAFALRGFGAPFFLFLAAERKFKELLVACTVFAACMIASTAAIPLTDIIIYYHSALGTAIECWQGHVANSSLITMPHKLLGSWFVSIGRGQRVCMEPELPMIDRIWGPLLLVIIFAYAYKRTSRAGGDSRFAFFLLLSVIGGPLTWPHYYLLLAPCAVIALVELRNFAFGNALGAWRAASLGAIVVLSLGWLSEPAYHHILTQWGHGRHTASPLVMILSCLPTVLGVVFLLAAKPDLFPKAGGKQADDRGGSRPV